jgi:hypothetical protein
MTQDVDVVSTRAEDLARELRDHLSEKFHIAVRVREVGDGRGFRVFQIRKSGNRQLVDVRTVDQMPPAERIEGVLVMAPAELIAAKVLAYHRRRGQPKSGTDWRDLAMLLLKFSNLKCDPGPVGERLKAAGADQDVMKVWQDLVAQEIRSEDDDEI